MFVWSQRSKLIAKALQFSEKGFVLKTDDREIRYEIKPYGSDLLFVIRRTKDKTDKTRPGVKLI